MANAIRSVTVAAVLVIVMLLLGAVGLVISFAQVEGRSSIGSRQLIVRTTGLRGIGMADGVNAGAPTTVNVGGHTVLVGADEVEVVGVRRVSLAPGCKQVEIVQGKGGLKVLLDGVESN